jgi:hypothetical protein
MACRRTLIGFALIAGLAPTSPARADHNHPKKASKMLVTFVRAMRQCIPPPILPHVHDAPLSFQACTPPTSLSPLLSFGPKGSGELRAVVQLDKSKLASDIKLRAKFVDVRVGDDGTGAGFNGSLLVVAIARVTDHDCDGVGNPCTPVDLPFPIQANCGTAASPPLSAGKCVAVTTTNTNVPQAVKPGRQGSWELTAFSVFNGNEQVFQQGLYLP